MYLVSIKSVRPFSLSQSRIRAALLLCFISKKNAFFYSGSTLNIDLVTGENTYFSSSDSLELEELLLSSSSKIAIERHSRLTRSSASFGVSG
jgi:hypothetical protein